ncbi:capsule biosynthesis protein [Pseudomonas sp. LTJR-52]|uniref:capsule biosynthesis protein n=1 Tax=Pseudomonas sp. LTJR-52 TaxID=2479392 RepID=UPI000EFB7065|nr:capsule biosynthesis protein [Pseudomonas sp. LTJR-52]AYN95734.1 capsule biosynthesis protein [Pseudomonas sp. LTJR-52]
MANISARAWKDKAQALDHYRWALLREQYSYLGALIRYARDYLRDCIFGFRARGRLAKAINVIEQDFVLLQSAPKVIGFQRKKAFLEKLSACGGHFIETALEEVNTILTKRLLIDPPQAVPLRYYGYAAHAEWLVAVFNPKILLNDRNGSLFSPFLRLSLNRRNSLLVHLAHATTVESSKRLSMNDYDYYFLFGKSSLEALRRRKLMFGTSCAVLSGSHMVDMSYDIPAADPTLRTILLLGVGPDKEKEPGYQKSYELVRQWAARHPEYTVLIKLHPRSKGTFWQESIGDNMRVLPHTESLADALRISSLVISIISNAVIEAALAGRPVIHVNLSRDRDIFEQAHFFGGCANTIELLNERIADIESEYASHVCESRMFADYHLSQGVDGLNRTLGMLLALQKGEVLEGEMLEERGFFR